MKLTLEQENQVRAFVNNQGLKIDSLKEDIIDHLCCVIETRLGKKKPFEQLLVEAGEELAPHGLIELERTTVFLLNSKRIIIMKKIMYLIGFIGSVTLTGGVVFKLLNFPGGYELFTIGFLMLFLVFIPLLAFDRYKVAISKAISERMKLILGTSAAVLTGLSGLFKVMHLQGAELLLMLGAIVFAVGFLPFFFFTMYKRAIA
ncbi:MAG: hypothetical protein AAF843_04465 [Bacteroidota bacterium]